MLKKTKTDVIVDFAGKRSIMHYIEATARYGVNIVICSTGYDKTQLSMIKKYADKIGVIGRHEIIFGNPYQTITPTPNTISRRAFGRGAIRAAHWIYGKNGFYTMANVVQ